MDGMQFIERAMEEVTKYWNERSEKTENARMDKDDLYVVWSCKTLQHNKALISSFFPDGMYYEVTYNGDKKEFYLDAYKKWENVCIPF